VTWSIWGILTDLQRGKDELEGEEDLEYKLQNQADNVGLDVTNDLASSIKVNRETTNELVAEADNCDDFALDRADDLGLIATLVAGHGGINRRGVLLHFDNSIGELVADRAIRADLVSDFGDISDIGHINDSGYVDGSRGGKGDRKKGGESDQAEVNETHFGRFLLDWRIKMSVVCSK